MVVQLSEEALRVVGYEVPDVEEIHRRREGIEASRLRVRAALEKARHSREGIEASRLRVRADVEKGHHSREGIGASSDAETSLGAESDRNQRVSAAEAAKEPMSTFTDLETIKKVEVEKVAVLSFRSLQLERIAEMQDDLLVLALAGTRGEAQDNDKIDKALQNYGMIDED